MSIRHQYPAVAKWLLGCRQEADDLNAVERDDITYRQRQGARQGLDDIIKAIENSKDALARAKE